MKQKIIILVALAVLLTSTAGFAAATGNTAKAQIALEKVEYTDATVTADKLNVREGPATSFDSIYKLEKGQAVTVIGKLGDWYAIYNASNGIIGAVDGKYLKVGDDSLAASKTGTDNEAVKGTPAKETPAKGTPAKETPAKGTPAKGTPAKETPAKGTPAKGAPVKETPAKGKGTTPSAINMQMSDDEQKLLELVNKARADKGLELLVPDESLMKVARTKAKDMIDNSYFSHQSPTYGSPFDMMRQFNTTFRSAGENIAGNKTVEGAFKAWMASESHKKNILNTNFTVTGIGIEDSSTYGKILVQQFIGK